MALAGVAQLVGAHPISQKAAASTPSQGMHMPRLWVQSLVSSVPNQGAYWRQLIDVSSLSLTLSFPLSLSRPSPLSKNKKSMSMSLGENKK